MKWNLSLFAIVIALSATLTGCSSGFVTVSPEPPQNYTRIAKAEGSACGSLGALATAYYFIPMGINSRMERAYSDALHSVPGSIALVDVTVQEDWYWWFAGTARCVTITGVAVK